MLCSVAAKVFYFLNELLMSMTLVAKLTLQYINTTITDIYEFFIQFYFLDTLLYFINNIL